MQTLSDALGAERDALNRRYVAANYQQGLAATDERTALKLRQDERRLRPILDRLWVRETPSERTLRRRAKRAGRRARDHGAEAARLGWQLADLDAERASAAAVVRALSVLPDGYRLLRGYRNAAGPIDLLVVGPTGVWAVAVHGRGVRLCVDGDRWWVERLDRRGRSDGIEWAVDDEDGRSWGRRLDEAATELARRLSIDDAALGRPSTIVAVPAPVSSVALLRGAEVDLVTADIGAVVAAVRDGARHLTPGQVRRVVEVAVETHRPLEADAAALDDAVWQL